jgi:hypothetical protein
LLIGATALGSSHPQSSVAAQNPAAAQKPATPEAPPLSPDAKIVPPPSTYHYPENTRWVYTVEWRLWTAGTASIELTADGSEHHVHGVADSQGAVALLYRVRDRFDSYFNTRTFCSSRIIKHSEEGLHRKQTSISFDYVRHKAVLDETNLRNNQKKHEEHDIPNCLTDVLSGIYYAATLPLETGKTYSFPLNDGNKTVQVNVTAEAREQVKTPAGTFRSVRVQPTAPAGVLKQRGRIWIWYTDDAQRIPVQMRARMLWGTLNIHLLRAERVTRPSTGE